MDTHVIPQKPIVELIHVPERDCVVIPRKIRIDEISSFFQEALGKLYGYAMQHAKPTDCFGRYRVWGTESCEVEAGVVIDRPLNPFGEIQPSKLGGHEALHARHIGPFDQVERTYALVQEYARDHEMSPSAPPYEIYLDDPAVTPENELRTDIYWPVRSG